MTDQSGTPPMEPDSSEATDRQLELALAQGEAYRTALEHMANDVADAGGTQRAGEYLVGYAIEEAERHDEINGRRLAAAVDVEFTGVPSERGSEPVQPRS